MDFAPQFAEDEYESPIVYINMPFGSPGLEAIHYRGYDQAHRTSRSSCVRLTNVLDSSFAKQNGNINSIDAQDSHISVDCCDFRDLFACPDFSDDLFWDAKFADGFWKKNCEGAEAESETELGHACECQETRNYSLELDWSTLDASRGSRSSLSVDANGSRKSTECQPRLKTKPLFCKHETSRGIRKKPSRSSKQPFRKSPHSVKGTTMCLRTLTRQLLAGTKWIAPGNIRKHQAVELAKILVGPMIEANIQLAIPSRGLFRQPEGWKEMYYTAVLSGQPFDQEPRIDALVEIISLYCGVSVGSGDVEGCFKIYHGTYHLSKTFLSILEGRPWPPCLPSQWELRGFGCHRLGEKP